MKNTLQSLQSEINQILVEFESWVKRIPSETSGGTLEEQLLAYKRERDFAAQSIIQSLRKRVPEKRPDLHKGNIELGYMQGYNQCRDDFINILDGVGELRPHRRNDGKDN